MPRPRPKKLDKNDKAAIERPFYFLSYSTGEPQIGLFVECLEIVFRDHFTLERHRAWAKQLGISHVWLLKLVRRFTTNPDEVRRLQAYGDPTLAQLDRAQEYTRQMRERGQLRLSRREKWVKFFERYPEARELYPKAASAVARREKSKA